MSHPTIHPTRDGHVELRHHGEQLAVLSDRDAETLGQALADLYGLVGDPSDAPERTGPDPAPGTRGECGTCAGPIEYVVRPADRQRYGGLAGRGGWCHLPVEPGEFHAAHPAGRVSEATGLDHGADARPDGGPR